MSLRDRANALAEHIIMEMDAVGQTRHLLLEWAKERVWGHEVQQCIPYFLRLYEHLLARDITSRDTSIYYGDMDVYYWIEPVDDSRKILVLDNAVTLADQSIFIYVYDDKGFEDKIFEQFLSVNVYPDGGKLREPPVFNDHRDIERLDYSIAKSRNFKFGFSQGSCGYGDVRDEGHNFIYTGRDQLVEKPHWNEPRVYRALTELIIAHDQIID